MSKFLTASLLCVSCAQPSIDTYLFTQGFQDAKLETVLEGAQVWEDAGFAIQPLNTTLPDDLTDVRLVTLVCDPQLTAYGGLSQPGKSRINCSLEGAQLHRIVAHELGHSLALIQEHLPSGQGVMSSPPAANFLTEADLELLRTSR